MVNLQRMVSVFIYQSVFYLSIHLFCGIRIYSSPMTLRIFQVLCCPDHSSVLSHNTRLSFLPGGGYRLLIPQELLIAATGCLLSSIVFHFLFSFYFFLLNICFSQILCISCEKAQRTLPFRTISMGNFRGALRPCIHVGSIRKHFASGLVTPR